MPLDRRDAKVFEAVIVEAGATVVWVNHSKHPAAVVRLGQHERKVFVPGTPGDRRSQKNTIRDIRRVIRTLQELCACPSPSRK